MLYIFLEFKIIISIYDPAWPCATLREIWNVRHRDNGRTHYIIMTIIVMEKSEMETAISRVLQLRGVYRTSSAPVYYFSVFVTIFIKINSTRFWKCVIVSRCMSLYGVSTELFNDNYFFLYFFFLLIVHP